uniref:Ig-like domain-containing protein n=1 Tax=Prolemur simus TaxID=1328070 RepID=A0A8C8YKN0_PROSS
MRTQDKALPKAAVRLEPPWINVLKEDDVTLTCWGAHTPGNYSTQWFHNGSSIPTQIQPSYRFKAKTNDSGEYRCQTGQSSLSDPVHLNVFSGLSSPEPKESSSSPMVVIVAVVTGIAVAAIVAVVAALTYRRRKRTSGLCLPYTPLVIGFCLGKH